MIKIYQFAHNLKQQIFDELGLPISIGIANSKWIAKLATNDAKPNGVKLILANKVDNYIKDKSIGEFCGVGKGYQTRLENRGIYKLGQVKDKKELFYSWGKFGKQLYHRILGTDDEKVIFERTTSKSIGLGRTFDPMNDRDEIKRRIAILCRHLSFLAFKSSNNPMTFSINLKYQYGERVKDHINTHRDFSEQLLKKEVLELFNKIDKHPIHNIVQINITLSNFSENKHITKNLFTQEDDTKQVKLTNTIQELRGKFGIDIIKSGGEL